MFERVRQVPTHAVGGTYDPAHIDRSRADGMAHNPARARSVDVCLDNDDPFIDVLSTDAVTPPAIVCFTGAAGRCRARRLCSIRNVVPTFRSASHR